MSRMNRLRPAPVLLKSSNQLSILWRWQGFALEVPHVDCRQPPSRYNRDKLRYPSDLTDAEWAHIEPLIPPGKISAAANGASLPRGDQRA